MERTPQIPAEKVEAFVRYAHRDIDQVKRLFAEEPALINASWDWGGGDWETALGAAAHTGRREIAEFLLAHGARLDLFAAAMLGKTAIVKAILESFPAMKDARGPHGIPLIVHAKFGGDQAAEVVQLLESP